MLKYQHDPWWSEKKLNKMPQKTITDISGEFPDIALVNDNRYTNLFDILRFHPK